MAGNRESGLRAAATNIAKYGQDFYKNIGAKGGAKGTGGGFTNRQLASEAGRKGGLVSRRGPSRKTIEGPTDVRRAYKSGYDAGYRAGMRRGQSPVEL